MTSWLRALGLRVGLLCALVASGLAVHMAVPRADLPFALLDSFDQAFAAAYDAAERKVARLEAASPPAPARLDVRTILEELEHQVTAACEAAATRLDLELVLAGSLSPERRHATLGCLERHLRAARAAHALSSDPLERAEHAATCDRLREVRALI